MAFDRLNQKSIVAANLDSFVSSSLTLLSNQRAEQNAVKESAFLNAVLEDDLTLDDQISYREDQVKTVPPNDAKERLRIRSQISNLKDLKQVETFNNEYLQQLTNFNSGNLSIDQTIKWLTDRRTRTTDTKIKNQINTQLNQLKAQRHTTRKNVVASQTTYAVNDKSEEVLGAQIKEVSGLRKEALLKSDDQFVATLDLQLQSLKKTLGEGRVTKALSNMSVSTLTGQSAVGMLNKFNSQVESADQGTPLTIGGTSYTSANEFWSGERSKYLNDRTANGFFGRYSTELKQQVDYKQSRKVLRNQDIAGVNNWYESIKDRPEMTGYEEKINQEQQRGLKYSTELKAVEAVNQFKTDLNAVKAVDTLSYLQETYGVNLTSAYQSVIQLASQEKESQIQQLLGTMGDIMKNSPGTSQQDALKQAVRSGAGVVFAPQELATNKASEIITDAGKKAASEEFGENGDKGITIPQAQKEVFTPGADLKEGDFFKRADSPTVMKFENGKLRPFEGTWTEETFRKATGKSFSDVQALPEGGNIATGQGIKTTDFNFANTAAAQGVNQGAAQTPQQQPTQAVKGEALDYQIQRGDTLSQIASKNNTSVDALMKANDTIQDANKIAAGQTIKIPKQ